MKSLDAEMTVEYGYFLVFSDFSFDFSPDFCQTISRQDECCDQFEMQAFGAEFELSLRRFYE